MDHVDEYANIVKDALYGKAGEKVREALDMDLDQWREEGLETLTNIIDNNFFRAID